MTGCLTCWAERGKCELCCMIEREMLFGAWMWGGIAVMCLAVCVFIVGAIAGWW